MQCSWLEKYPSFLVFRECFIFESETNKVACEYTFPETQKLPPENRPSLPPKRRFHLNQPVEFSGLNLLVSGRVIEFEPKGILSSLHEIG